MPSLVERGRCAKRSRGSGSRETLSLRILVLALIGGLILNLMPCVFPVLGIKVVGFVNQAGGDRRKVTMHGLAFTAGVVLSFWVLAAALAALRAGGSELGWGFQLQSAAFVFALSVIMLVFAMSLSGVFEFGLRATGVGSELTDEARAMAAPSLLAFWPPSSPRRAAHRFWRRRWARPWRCLSSTR